MIRWLSILLALLVPGGYYVCELFFSNDLESWWHLRQAIYSIEVALAFQIIELNEKNRKWEIFYFIATGICIQNAADNIGKIYDYSWFDLVAIAITLTIAYLKYVKKWSLLK